MTNNPTALCHVQPYASQSSIQTANGSSLPIAAIDDASSKFINVFFASQLSTNLISVGQLVDNNCAVNFSSNGCVVQDQVTREPIAKGPKVGHLFPLFLPIPDFSPLSSIKSFACNNVSNLSMVWHRRLSHPNTQILSHVLNFDLPGNKDHSSLSLECDSCKLGKSKTLHFPLHTSRASHCFDLIHSDVWGPFPVSSHEKFKYYVTFIDDHSRFTWVYFLRSKSEVFHTFTKFLAYVDNQFSTSIKTLRINFGGEYLSTEFQVFLASKGIIHQRSCSSTPQQNGVAERKNRHLLDVSYIWSLLISAYLLSNLVMITFVFLVVSSQIFIPSVLAFNQIQSVAAPPVPLVHRFPRVSVPSNRYGFPYSSSGNSISTLTAALSNFDIPTCYSHAAKHDCWRQAILDRYKAWLVALGNNQEYGVNYEETFAPMAKMTIVSTILALAASNDWPLHQMDVKNVFLHGDLKECIYMKPPPGLFPSPTSHVYMGIVVLLVYVDDIVITGSDSTLLGQLKTHIFESFHMKDLGWSTRGYFYSYSMELNVKLCKEKGDLLADPSLYRKLVGSLVYLTITRPDISFVVQQVSQFLQTPRHLHLATARRIICYVQGTSTRGLFFPTGNSTRLAAYSDADWASCSDTCRSITSWCVFLSDALISWKSKKQDRVSKSSTESKYWAMSLACSEIIWLRGLLTELDFSETDPTPLHANNTSDIQITTNPVYHERTKHIEVDCHSIREAFEARVITLPHISTDLQIADIFTKALPRHRHCLLSSKLMLVDQLASI
ncbi:Retrovirus-related Pol polyprotein from transposon RE1 [Vitis vinifera]|uniref:Retrovirus-related Pol polyprotein from transposon RE1 n=1 Tax=Vitis vinifera TaxID=29760 RepID=A0A438JR63_VITVI|nr:Retrovirus-related Pol polyprotein from transposon RE1 [Vitis vinifera]